MSEQQKGRDLLEDKDTSGKIILNCVLHKALGGREGGGMLPGVK
jgi:hypothetical protein